MKYKKRIQQVIDQEVDLFSSKLSKFNDEVTMLIPFKDESDVKGLKQSLYSLFRRDQKALNSVMNPLKTDSRIEDVPLKQLSVTSSPAFVVWKGNKPCVVINLYKVNTKLYPDAYLLPKQDQVLNAIGGSMIFSSMNIVKGFF